MDSKQTLQMHQIKAVESVISNIQKSEQKTLLQFAAGAGVHLVVKEIIIKILQLFDNPYILILTPRIESGYAISNMFNRRLSPDAISNILSTPIKVSTYSRYQSEEFSREYLQRSVFIICLNAENASISGSFIEMGANLVGITALPRIEKGLFKNTHFTYRYTIENAIKEGSSSPQFNPQFYGLAIEGFCERLLIHLIGKLSKTEVVHTNTADFEFNYRNTTYLVEVKSYRSRYAPIQGLETAISLLNKLVKKQAGTSGLLITFSEVPEVFKQQIFADYQITLWDISNILYYSANNAELLGELPLLTYFSVSDIIPAVSCGWNPSKDASSVTIDDRIDESIVLKQRLDDCNFGKQFSSEYENICVDIITYLFTNEFFIISNQHTTSDTLFRMDLICSLKGESAFWKYLVRHFNTRYIVFEFKNYSGYLDQNLIFVTEKYLFNAALRNVAIMISRKGFSKNASVASLGCLKESGKLIIDLTDADLKTMLAKKAEGADPSDYLLEKLDHLLMSISK